MIKKTDAFSAALFIVLFAGGCRETVTFGIVADIQYHPGKPLGTRFYSASLDKLFPEDLEGLLPLNTCS